MNNEKMTFRFSKQQDSRYSVQFTHFLLKKTTDIACEKNAT